MVNMLKVLRQIGADEVSPTGKFQHGYVTVRISRSHQTTLINLERLQKRLQPCRLVFGSETGNAVFWRPSCANRVIRTEIGGQPFHGKLPCNGDQSDLDALRLQTGKAASDTRCKAKVPKILDERCLTIGTTPFEHGVSSIRYVFAGPEPLERCHFR